MMNLLGCIVTLIASGITAPGQKPLVAPPVDVKQGQRKGALTRAFATVNLGTNGGPVAVHVYQAPIKRRRGKLCAKQETAGHSTGYRHKPVYAACSWQVCGYAWGTSFSGACTVNRSAPAQIWYKNAGETGMVASTCSVEC